jgi:hypothetical protein
VIDSAGQKLAYVYFEDEPGRRSVSLISSKPAPLQKNKRSNEKGLRRALHVCRSPSSADAIDRESLRVDGLFLSISDSQWCGKFFAFRRLPPAAFS